MKQKQPKKSSVPLIETEDYTQGTNFRNASNGRYLRGLFLETTLDKTVAPYTLKTQDYVFEGKKFKSLYRLYMETNDPTEYEFAIKYLDGWDHWVILSNCTWFKEHVDKWRYELTVRVKSKCIKELMIDAKNPLSKNYYAANKLLLDKGWLEKEEKPSHGRGRPSKDEIHKAAKEQADIERKISEDFERVIIGGKENKENKKSKEGIR